MQLYRYTVILTLQQDSSSALHCGSRLRSVLSSEASILIILSSVKNDVVQHDTANYQLSKKHVANGCRGDPHKFPARTKYFQDHVIIL